MRKAREPTSGLEPLTCSLRVRNRGSTRVQTRPQTRINKRFLGIPDVCGLARIRPYWHTLAYYACLHGIVSGRDHERARPKRRELARRIGAKFSKPQHLNFAKRSSRKSGRQRELVDAALRRRGFRLPVRQNDFLPTFVRTRPSGLVAFLPFPSNHQGSRDRARGRHPR
jgi:hypothetical protein